MEFHPFVHLLNNVWAHNSFATHQITVSNSFSRVVNKVYRRCARYAFFRFNPRLLKGPGDGMSDNIPATINGRQPARLADGEFVIPADVVSHLCNGSTEAGAKQLHAMMNKVRSARTGNSKQGKQIKPQKYMPR